MMGRALRRAWAGVLVVGLGCGSQADFADPLPDELEGSGTKLVFRTLIDNGIVPNGFEFNGIRWNGIRWNGIRWNGIRWNGVELNSTTSLTNIYYDSTSGTLVGEDDSSNLVALGPNDEVFAEGDYDDGSTITDFEIMISEIEQVTGGTHPYQFHRVQTRMLPDGEWEDACHDGGGNPVKAILLKGDWVPPEYARSTETGADEATTWACRGAALAKCVEWGYHPEGTVSSTLLSDHHQACTRMVRADYCGDGEHHTENGTIIDVDDSLGINEFETSWVIESAWGPDGALCLNEPRKTYWSRTDALTECSSVPSCDANDNDDLTDDAAHWYGQGALMVTRAEPTALLVSPPAPADSGG